MGSLLGEVGLGRVKVWAGLGVVVVETVVSLTGSRGGVLDLGLVGVGLVTEVVGVEVIRLIPILEGVLRVLGSDLGSAAALGVIDKAGHDSCEPLPVSEGVPRDASRTMVLLALDEGVLLLCVAVRERKKE